MMIYEVWDMNIVRSCSVSHNVCNCQTMTTTILRKSKRLLTYIKSFKKSFGQNVGKFLINVLCILQTDS